MLELSRFDKYLDKSCICVEVGDEFKVFDPLQDPLYKHLIDQRNHINACTLYDFNRELLSRRQQISDYFCGEYTETSNEEFALI